LALLVSASLAKAAYSARIWSQYNGSAWALAARAKASRERPQPARTSATKIDGFPYMAKSHQQYSNPVTKDLFHQL
jgi:hypothetical protein